MKQSKSRARLLVLMAGILWGTTGSAQAFAPESATPMVIGALRMLVGGVALFLLAQFRGAYKEKLALDKKLVLMTSTSVALFQLFFFLGVSKTGIAFGTVLAIGSAPIFSGALEYFTGEKLSKKWVFGTLLSIVGCILLFSGQGFININIFGSILSLGAGLSYAMYVKSSQGLYQNSPRDAVNGIVFLISALILSPILLTNDLSWVASTRGTMVVLHLGLVATALAYTLFSSGLVSISTPNAVTLTLAEPLTAAILGVLIFNERLTGISTFGILLLFCGLLINTYPEKEKLEVITT